jgi:tetratricopeptide (TPR) repeat protein
MWSPRFTNRATTWLILPGIALVAAGCASSGPERAEVERVEGTQLVQRDAAATEIPTEAMTMYEQAVAVMASGDLLDAELRLKEFVLRYPRYPGAYVNLAIIHLQDEDVEAARAAIDAALMINPDYSPALNQYGVLLRKNGKILEAEAAYLKAITADPEYALAHYNLGVLYELYLQRLGDALQHFERYQDLAGDDPQVEKWITDLKRRVAAKQRTANVAE